MIPPSDGVEVEERCLGLWGVEGVDIAIREWCSPSEHVVAYGVLDENSQFDAARNASAISIPVRDSKD